MTLTERMLCCRFRRLLTLRALLAFATFILMASVAFAQDDRLQLPTPQITDITYVGEGIFGPRYKIDFVSAQPSSYDCTVRLWIVLDRDGQFSYTTNTLGERKVDTGGDEFRRIPLHGRDIERMSYTPTLAGSDAQEWLDSDNPIYAYAYNDSFTCYSDVSTVVQLPLKWSRLFRQVEGFAKVYSGCVVMPS